MARELNDNKLEGVAGGYIHHLQKGRLYRVPNTNLPHFLIDYYEIIDDKDGSVVKICKSEDDAIKIAQIIGLSTKEISDIELKELRENAKKEKQICVLKFNK